MLALKRLFVFHFVLLFLFSTAAFAKDTSSEMGFAPSRHATSAPEFTLIGVDGKEKSLSEFKGKVVLLNFWATWCDPCREEMPAMEKLWAEFKAKGLVILAVANDKGSMHKVEEFCRMHDVTFPVLLDPSGDVKSAYSVTMMPTSYIIGKDGSIAGKIVGARKWDSEASKKLFNSFLLK